MICKKLLNIKNPTLQEMNKVISQQLCSIFFPVIDSSSQLLYSTIQNKFQYFNDIYDATLMDVRYKMLTIKNVPQMPELSKEFSNDSWNSLEKRAA